MFINLKHVSNTDGPPFLSSHRKDHWAGWGPQDFNSYYTELLCCLVFICFCTYLWVFVYFYSAFWEWLQAAQRHIYLDKCVLKRWSISHSVWHATLHEPKRLEATEVKLALYQSLSRVLMSAMTQIMEPFLQLESWSLNSVLHCHAMYFSQVSRTEACFRLK